MLDAARRKAGRTPITLVHGDMRNFSLGRRFALVIIPFRGFLSLLTVEDQVSTLDCISDTFCRAVGWCSTSSSRT